MTNEPMNEPLNVTINDEGATIHRPGGCDMTLSKDTEGAVLMYYMGTVTIDSPEGIRDRMAEIIKELPPTVHFERLDKETGRWTKHEEERESYHQRQMARRAKLLEELKNTKDI